MEMTESLAQFLNAEGINSAKLQYAVRYLIARTTDFTPADELRRIAAAAASDELVDQAVTELSANSDALLEADLVVLDAFWADKANRDEVREAVRSAAERLPVDPAVLLAVPAVYGLFVAVTKGRKKVNKITRYNADGTWEQQEQVEYQDPVNLLKPLGALLTKFAEQPPKE
ncbi:hypothetical protein [Micromonospora sp. NPDC049662]|uniref:hypothetical protein n=1 Tax=Micromonospora sp. NPDC049662 TaxID=3155397 RepID=UPI003422D9B5